MTGFATPEDIARIKQQANAFFSANRRAMVRFDVFPPSFRPVREEVEEWLNMPVSGLNWATPLRAMETKEGFRAVERLLGRQAMRRAA